MQSFEIHVTTTKSMKLFEENVAYWNINVWGESWSTYNFTKVVSCGIDWINQYNVSLEPVKSLDYRLSFQST